MAEKIDVRDTDVVISSAKWRPFSKYVAIATGVTSDGRTAQGIGSARWSGETALDAAVENLKDNARETDFSFKIQTLIGGNSNVRVEFLEKQGIYQKKSATRGMTQRRTVEITAEEDGRTVTAKDDIGMVHIGIGRASWQETLDSALDVAESQLQRVGTESLDD